ncbi:MAG TPA: protein kinase [Ignavibacteria bacterium]
MIGRFINNYRIIDKIGEGGMSEVYLAEHKYLHKYNALKKLKLQDKTIIDKFIKEAQILYNLNHKFIVKVGDCFDFEDSLYIVMEYVEGEPLNEYISKRERISEDKAIEIFKKILYGIDYAHSLNIIHRDLKPSNIIIDKNENPKILDFGIAKIVKAGIGSGTTSTSIFMGSPAYMSPEQYKNEKIDLRTDIYSLGMVLYEMVTGINPYQSEEISLASLSYKIVHESLPDPKIYLPKINDNCRKLILKCAQKKPENRFNTCKEIIDYIDKIEVQTIKIEPEKIKEEIKIKWYKKNKITLSITLIIIIICLGLTGKYLLFTNNENQTKLVNIINDSVKNALKHEWKLTQLNKNWDITKIQFVNDTIVWMLTKGSERGIKKGIGSNENLSHINWKEINYPGTMIGDIYFIDNETGWITTKDYSNFYYHKNPDANPPELLMKTTNGGNNWFTQLKVKGLLIGISFGNLFFLNENTGYIAYNNCIFKTTNGGKKWTQKKVSDVQVYIREENKVIPKLIYKKVNFKELLFINENKGWGISDSTILYTTDSGDNWEYSSDISAKITKCYFIDENTGWFIGENGEICKTEHGSNRWFHQKQKPDKRLFLNDVFFINVNTGWVVGDYGCILRTTNCGTNWEFDSIPTKAHLKNIAKSSNKLWVVGGEGVILTLELEQN